MRWLSRRVAHFSFFTCRIAFNAIQVRTVVVVRPQQLIPLPLRKWHHLPLKKPNHLTRGASHFHCSLGETARDGKQSCLRLHTFNSLPHLKQLSVATHQPSHRIKKLTDQPSTHTIHRPINCRVTRRCDSWCLMEAWATIAYIVVISIRWDVKRNGIFRLSRSRKSCLVVEVKDWMFCPRIRSFPLLILIPTSQLYDVQRAPCRRKSSYCM